MTPEQILSLVPPPVHPRLKYGKTLYEFITTNRLSTILELRSVPGITTAYLAGAIQEQGTGTLKSVCQRVLQPIDYNVPEALQLAKLSSFVTLYEEPTNFDWQLMKFLQEGLFETFDLCLIEGGQTWSNVGFACCLAERLLKPGGWILLDNMNFSFHESKLKNKKWVTNKQEDEQTMRQVNCVYDLLLRENPNFGRFLKRGPLAFTQKRRAVWSQELLSQNRREAYLYDAVERARHDPEFREDLLENPRKALGGLSSDVFDNQMSIRFVDTDETYANLSTGSNEVVVFLDRPKWEASVTEDYLNKMLNA